jgi:hypothetical protein
LSRRQLRLEGGNLVGIGATAGALSGCQLRLERGDLARVSGRGARSDDHRNHHQGDKP